MDESIISIAVVGDSSVEEIVEDNARGRMERNNEDIQFVNEDGEPEDADRDEEESNADEEDEDFPKSRAKMPRLHSNLDLKAANETDKKDQSNCDEEVYERKIFYIFKILF